MFILGKNDEVNLMTIKNHKTNSIEIPTIKSHKTNSLETPAIESHSNTAQGLTHASAISHHENEKAVFILLLTGGFTVWFLFR